ncbi:MAG: hypothetical protein LBV77_02280 [Candidatus Adiutrix intracellularis]|jgi:hypothetical protein|nr:hypothetical protein [Candidatus Adiutrix intracellularis]
MARTLVKAGGAHRQRNVKSIFHVNRAIGLFNNPDEAELGLVIPSPTFKL